MEGDGRGNMGLRRERSGLEPHCAASVETLYPSSSSMEAMDAGDEEVVPSGKDAPLSPLHLLQFLKDEGENATMTRTMIRHACPFLLRQLIIMKKTPRHTRMI